MKNIISLSHCDLDAMGCQIIIENKFPNMVEYFNTNYVNLNERVDEIIEYTHRNSTKLIICTDISFSQCKHSLETLISLNIPIIFIDHHIYPDGFFDSFENNQKLVINHNIDKCASLLTYEYFKMEDPLLKKLCVNINAYDLWQTKSEHFMAGFYLNEYFWYNMPQDIDIFMRKFIEADNSIPPDFTIVCKQIKQESQKHIKMLHNNHFIHSVNGITIVFTDNYYNHILYEYFKNSQNIAMIVCTSYGSIRVRFNQYSSLSNEAKESMKYEIINDRKSGHTNAFTYKMPKGSMNHYVPELKRVSDIIDRLRD